MYEQNASHLVKDSKLGVKILHKNFLKNGTKSTKMAITLPKLSEHFQSRITPYFPKAVFVPRFASAGKNINM